LSGDSEKSVRLCPLCNCRVPLSENVCPQCGNVFHKESSDWEWKRVSKEGKARSNNQEKSEEKTE